MLTLPWYMHNVPLGEVKDIMGTYDAPMGTYRCHMNIIIMGGTLHSNLYLCM